MYWTLTGPKAFQASFWRGLWTRVLKIAITKIALLACQWPLDAGLFFIFLLAAAGFFISFFRPELLEIRVCAQSLSQILVTPY